MSILAIAARVLSSLSASSLMTDRRWSSTRTPIVVCFLSFMLAMLAISLAFATAHALALLAQKQARHSQQEGGSE